MAQRGMYIRTEETRQKMRVAASRQREMSAETRAKISKAGKGLKRSPETCARISLARRGMKATDAQRAAMRIGQQRRRERDKVIVHCEWCDAVFQPHWQYYGRQRFCTRTCANTATAKPKQSPYLTHLQEFLRNCIHRLGVNTKGLESLRRNSETILGYGKHDLRAHLEAAFEDGMRWNNYGGRHHGAENTWVIDHIHPISAYLSAGITDPKIINALSNLQPLWSADNRQKQNKVAS